MLNWLGEPPCSTCSKHLMMPVVCKAITVLQLFFCWIHTSGAAPLPVTDQALKESGFDNFYGDGVFMQVVGGMLLICLSLLTVGCLCCKQSGIFKGFHVNYNLDTSRNSYVAFSEFSMAAPGDSTPNSPAPSSPNGGRVSFDPLPSLSNVRASVVSTMSNESVSLKANFPRAQLQFVKQMGYGWFGQVLQGEALKISVGLRKSKVVVKMLKEDASEQDELRFFEEMAPYRDLNHHNVLPVLAQCIDAVPYLIIMEHVPFGDAKCYMQKHAADIRSFNQRGVVVKFACDIAAGLQALHHYGYAHHDLALRNCYVSMDLSLKVGEYGIAQDIYKALVHEVGTMLERQEMVVREEDYIFTDTAVIPLRWCDPESLLVADDTLAMKEPSKQDNVWSLGVTLWELVEYGKQPYFGISNAELTKRVKESSSLKLPCPTSVVAQKGQLYEVMKLCWSAADKRPDIDEIHNKLNNLDSIEVKSETPQFEKCRDQIQPTKDSTNSQSPDLVPASESVSFSQQVSQPTIQVSTANQSSKLNAETVVHYQKDKNVPANLENSLKTASHHDANSVLPEIQVQSPVTPKTGLPLESPLSASLPGPDIETLDITGFHTSTPLKTSSELSVYVTPNTSLQTVTSSSSGGTNTADYLTATSSPSRPITTPRPVGTLDTSFEDESGNFDVVLLSVKETDTPRPSPHQNTIAGAQDSDSDESSDREDVDYVRSLMLKDNEEEFVGEMDNDGVILEPYVEVEDDRVNDGDDEIDEDIDYPSTSDTGSDSDEIAGTYDFGNDFEEDEIKDEDTEVPASSLARDSVISVNEDIANRQYKLARDSLALHREHAKEKVSDRLADFMSPKMVDIIENESPRIEVNRNVSTDTEGSQPSARQLLKPSSLDISFDISLSPSSGTRSCPGTPTSTRSSLKSPGTKKSVGLHKSVSFSGADHLEQVFHYEKEYSESEEESDDEIELNTDDDDPGISVSAFAAKYEQNLGKNEDKKEAVYIDNGNDWSEDDEETEA